jgi:hypothetical protein
MWRTVSYNAVYVSQHSVDCNMELIQSQSQNHLFHIYTLISPHWTRVVGYGPFSLCVIHKEGPSLNSGDINRLMMMIMMTLIERQFLCHLLHNYYG